jgi:sugar phosphate isomerase/epimerase
VEKYFNTEMKKTCRGYVWLAVILPAFLFPVFRAEAQGNTKPTLGIIADAAGDSLFFALGFRFREESVVRSFSPRKVDETEFAAMLPRFRASGCRVLSANVFLPGELKLLGPDRDEPAILGYADTVFRRCAAAGLHIVVLGSGGSRKIPEGYDRALARREFVETARKLATLAGRYGITLAMENLNRGETNFGNTLAEVTGIARDVDDPHFRVTADIFHMLRESEPPSAIAIAGKLLVHCHIAENRDRAGPGTHGEDFRPYLAALQLAGFHGLIMMECNWKNAAREAGPAWRYLQGQVDEVYH